MPPFPIRQELTRALAGDVAILSAHPFDDADPLWQLASAESIDLLVLDAAELAGVMRDWPAAAIGLARRHVLQAQLLEDVRERELRRLLQAIGRARLSCVLVKGAALAHSLYRRPFLRPRQDTDLFVLREELDAFEAVLTGEGYVKAVEPSGELTNSQCHFDRANGLPGVYALDIHWQIANPLIFAECVSMAALVRSAVPIGALGPAARGLDPGHALFLACVHRVAHHLDSVDLLWLWDIHLLALRLTPGQAAGFATLATQARMRAVCCRGLDLAFECFAADATRTLSDSLRPRPDAAPEPSAAFLRPRLRPVDVLLSDLATARTWRDRTRLLREHLVPSIAYLRSRYPRWPAALLPLAYLHRTLRGLPKWLRRPPV